MIYQSHEFDQIESGLYQHIYADPAWDHKSYSTRAQNRSPSSHYPVMHIKDIRAMNVRRLAAPDCHLMLWTTQPHLVEAIDVMRDWGFRYSSVFQFWLKLNPKSASALFLTAKDFHRGMGFTTRKNIEILLLGRKGKPKRLAMNIPDFVIAARRQHSRKPDSVVVDMERYCAGPRLELFGRESRPGWDTWGNQVDVPLTVTANRPPAKRLITPPALVAPDPDQIDFIDSEWKS